MIDTGKSGSALRSSAAKALAQLGSVFGTVMLALLPKCPICGAAYLSAAGIVALPTFPGWLAYWPVLAALVLVQLLIAGRAAVREREWSGLIMSSIAAVLAVVGLGIDSPLLMWAAAAVATGSAVMAAKSALVKSKAASEPAVTCAHCRSL